MFAQTERALKLTTPLGPDALIVRAVRGREAISELFRFEVDAVSEDKKKPIVFDQLLGQKVGLRVTMKSQTRYFHGIVVRLSQGERDDRFIHYRLEIMPQLWKLTRSVRSRIFQQMTVPDILKKVLDGVDASYEFQGSYEPREYCIQYHESDFDFFSRLAEEEGIYYYFKHAEDAHKLLVADTPQSHADIPYTPTVEFEETADYEREEARIVEWEKAQEIRAGKFVAWDEHFQLPTKHLEAEKPIQDSVQVAKAAHKLAAGGGDKLEIYEFPGGYARRFDGVNKGGGDQAGNLQKIFQDNKRTVGIRMQQEAVGSLLIRGCARHAAFTAGETFDLTKHFSDDGKYVLTSVEHKATQPVRSDEADTATTYENRFECIPAALPYRPLRRTPEPSVRGVQLATVTGPAGDEIFTDKYGRIKVQFHWDREGKNDASSSCWVRVATYWAGKQWGAIHIPRIGQEVIVDFEEGDVNHPIVVGSVYNADLMPPYTLPDNKTQSGIKSRSSKGGGPDNFNEIRFEDKKGSEEVYVHAEKDLVTYVENDETRTVDHDRTTTIKNNETKTVTEGNESTTIKKGDRTLEVTMGKQTHTIQGNMTCEVKQGNQSTTIDMGNKSTKIKMGNMDTKLDLGASTEEAMQSIELKVGQSSIKVDQTGVTIKGMMIKVEGQIQVQIKGLMTQVNGDAMLIAKGGITMIN